MTARWQPQGTGSSPAHVLSKTSAHLLISRSPLHAKIRKDRAGQEDNDEGEREREDMERGSIIHAMLLGVGKGFAVAEYSPEPTADDALAGIVDRFEETGEVPEVDPEAPTEPAPKGRKKKPPKPPEPPPVNPHTGKPEWTDWRRGDAQKAKAAIRARGLIPLLPKHSRIYQAQASKVADAIEAHGIRLNGVSEPGIVWYEPTTDGSGDEVECWGALDHWHAPTRTIYDLKIVRSAHPDACRKHLYAYGGDIQAAAYTSAVEQVHPELAGRVRFVFVFCELHSGAVTPVTLAGDYAQLGRMRWARAVNTWARCLRTGHWPAYVEQTIAMSAPEWAFAEEMGTRAEDNERAMSSNTRPAVNAEQEDDADEPSEWAESF